jgi:hypothetical protein
MELPHRFPFRWLDRSGSGVARLELSANSYWLRGAKALPTAFCAEIVAQAAARLLEDQEVGGAEPGQRWLAGIERLELVRPLLAGEHLEVRVRPEARFGRIVKVVGEIWAADGEPERLCAATLLLSA